MCARSECSPTHTPLQSPRHQLCCPTAYTESSTQPAPTPSLSITNVKQEAGPSPRTRLLHARSWSRSCPSWWTTVPQHQPCSGPQVYGQCSPRGPHHGLQLHFSLAGKQPPRHKCGNQKDCPQDNFAFKIISGAANVVGPSICFNDIM